MPPTIVRYTLSRTDLFRAQVRSLLRNRLILLFYCVVGLLVFWAGTRGAAANAPMLVRIIGGFITSILFVILSISLTIPLLIASTFKRNTGILGEHEIELKEEGLLERTEANETLNRWGTFYKVASTRHALHIYVTDTQIHIIPRRFFSTPEQMRQFHLEIEKRVAGAKAQGKTVK